MLNWLFGVVTETGLLVVDTAADVLVSLVVSLPGLVVCPATVVDDFLVSEFGTVLSGLGLEEDKVAFAGAEVELLVSFLVVAPVVDADVECACVVGVVTPAKTKDK